MRTSFSFPLESDFLATKRKILHWAKNEPYCAFLDSNQHSDRFGNYETVLAVGALETLTLENTKDAFQKLDAFQKKCKDYIFGFLSYDLKNEIHALHSHQKDDLQFPELFFFRPEKIIFLRENELEFLYVEKQKKNAEKDFQSINTQNISGDVTTPFLSLNQRLTKSDYLKKVNDILECLQRGDLYEVNFCMEFYAKGVIEPMTVFERLNDIAKSPFACYFRKEDHYILSSSPERYLRKKGQMLLSEPIKGTAPRGNTIEKDKENAKALLKSTKERAENTMIIDLVRNDLSRVAKKATVKVLENCQLRTFKQVHQLVSTVVCELEKNVSLSAILKATFPMGSMTGAPKIAAMKLIEDTETTKRGMYSGTVGYCSPEGDFDFSVVIRTILYNATQKYISCSVGSAITHLSSPEKEWEECLVKVAAMKKILQGI